MYGTFIVGVCTSYQLYIYSLSPKKSRNRKVFWYFCHVWILCGITLGILNIVLQKYDAYTSIYLGIICSCYTYYDNKQNPVSKRTNAYISSLQGYVAGIGFLLYGLLSLQNIMLCLFQMAYCVKLGLISLQGVSPFCFLTVLKNQHKVYAKKQVKN